jgi:hypothetical protein
MRVAESAGLIDKLRRHGLHMPNETNALAVSPQAGAPREGDYQAVCAALSESERGRAFLAEYARRNRAADTELLLAALDRLTVLVRADAAALDRLRGDLRMLLIAIRLARPEIDAANVPGKAARLTVLLDMLERRIDAMADTKSEIAAPANETLGAHAMPDEPAVEDARARLAVVPPPDEPELPIPSPAGIQPPTISLVTSAAMMPQIVFVERAQPAPAEVAVPAAEPAATLLTLRPGALAAILALSEDERLALFT